MFFFLSSYVSESRSSDLFRDGRSSGSEAGGEEKRFLSADSQKEILTAPEASE